MSSGNDGKDGGKNGSGKDAGGGKKVPGSSARKPTGRYGDALHQRVKTAKGRTASSNRWLSRQLNDPYVRKAKADGYRSRAAYKLVELDEKFALVRKARHIIDLGIAPGGWAQLIRRINPKAAVVGIDLLPVDPIEGVTIFEMDFMADHAPDTLIEALGAQPDLVLSDMAANTVGHKQTDHLRTMGLVEAAAHFAVDHLVEGGAFVAKVLAGGTDNELLALLKQHFKTVKHAKPPASRKASSEWYVIAQGRKPRVAIAVESEDSDEA
ncbi:RlmE family RNA methyltransferase [Blastomonas sp.]|uniref:RlmE family RNA methyltransferase n=1 Tax=Blastomonas sp. TaxID=1909299 RepID=UPI00261BAAC4|nr:RlmE family RNA methyltransferase [Blastomonas sp.]MDM7955821.1 RlmE family RNA methyltransferase [Blastomonas sp.]